MGLEQSEDFVWQEGERRGLEERAAILQANPQDRAFPGVSTYRRVLPSYVELICMTTGTLKK